MIPWSFLTGYILSLKHWWAPFSFLCCFVSRFLRFSSRASRRIFQMPSFTSPKDDNLATNETLLSILFSFAQQTPNNDFLIEDINECLSYQQSYILATRLLPNRLLQLFPALSTPRRRKVVLIAPNSSLFILTLWALWSMSFTAVPITVKSEQTLWGPMVDSVDPDVVLISRRRRPGNLD